MKVNALVLNAGDNVAVLLHKVKAGDVVCTDQGKWIANEPIDIGHKICIRAIRKCGDIVKYGLTIGNASRDIATGDWVHSHNVEDTTEMLCNAYATAYYAKSERNAGNK